MGVYLKFLFQLLLSPGHGWEDIDKASLHPKLLAARGFYRLTAITALTAFAEIVTHRQLTIGDLLVDAIITFVMYFMGYFVATFVLTTILRRVTNSGADDRRCQLFAMFCMGLLELIQIFGNLVPITMAITWFMPIYVAVVIWKGAGYMSVASHNVGRFMLVAVPGVLFPPYVLNFVLMALLK